MDKDPKNSHLQDGVEQITKAVEIFDERKKNREANGRKSHTLSISPSEPEAMVQQASRSLDCQGQLEGDNLQTNIDGYQSTATIVRNGSDISLYRQNGVFNFTRIMPDLGDSSDDDAHGCPYAQGASGNVATEDVVYLLNGLNINTGIHFDKLLKAGWFISDKLGKTPISKVSNAYLAKFNAQQTEQ